MSLETVMNAARALADAEADAMALHVIYKAKLDEVHAEHEKELRQLIAAAEALNKELLSKVAANPALFADVRSSKLDQLNFGIRQVPREIVVPADLVQRLEAAPEFVHCLKVEVKVRKAVLNTLSDEVLALFNCQIVPPKDQAFVTSKNTLGMPK